MHSRSKATLFLFELVIIIIIFAVCCVVWLNLFVTAHEKSTSAKNLTQAVLLTQNTAERLQGFSGSSKNALAAFFGAATEADCLLLYYGEDGFPTDAKNASYTVKLTPSFASDMLECTIETIVGDETIHSISTARVLVKGEAA